MIHSRKDLRFYIAADRIMNGFSEHKTIKEFLVNIFDRPVKGVIISYLSSLRHYAYYRNTVKSKFSIKILPLLWWHRRLNILSLKLGYSIGPNSIGYGLVLPRQGTIVVNPEAKIGNFCVLHPCSCISGTGTVVGDYLYLPFGAQLAGTLNLGDGITLANHTLLNEDITNTKCLLSGNPAQLKTEDYPLWTELDGESCINNINKVLKLENKIYNSNV